MITERDVRLEQARILARTGKIRGWRNNAEAKHRMLREYLVAQDSGIWEMTGEPSGSIYFDGTHNYGTNRWPDRRYYLKSLRLKGMNVKWTDKSLVVSDRWGHHVIPRSKIVAWVAEEEASE